MVLGMSKVEEEENANTWGDLSHTATAYNTTISRIGHGQAT